MLNTTEVFRICKTKYSANSFDGEGALGFSGRWNLRGTRMIYPAGSFATMATTINISIPENLKIKVEEVIASEGYGNTSEFFRDLVRDYLERRQEKKLESLLLEGLESGEATPLTKTDFEDIKKRELERIKNKQQ